MHINVLGMHTVFSCLFRGRQYLQVSSWALANGEENFQERPYIFHPCKRKKGKDRMPSAAGVAAGASLPPLPPTAQRTYDGALSSLLSPLHQASAPAAIQAASLRRTRTPSDLREYLARIGLPHDLPGAHCRNVVHVTGTKGKGSTAALAEGGLRGRETRFRPLQFRNGRHTFPGPPSSR